jgi:hypothetical protein
MAKRRTLPMRSGVNVAATKDEHEVRADVTMDRDELYRLFAADLINKQVYLRNAERLASTAKPQILPNPFQNLADFMASAPDMLTKHALGQGSITYAVKPKQFGTGSYGWNHRQVHNVQIGGKECSVSVNVVVAVCGSKNSKNSG